MALVAIPMLIASMMEPATGATYYLSRTYGVDSVAPAGKTPWLTLTTTTLGGADAGKVQLEFHASGLTGPEYLDEWYLNFDPKLDPTKLSFGSAVKTGSFSLPTINLASDGYKAGPDGRFDIKLLFSSSNAGGGVNRFKVRVDELFFNAHLEPFSSQVLIVLNRCGQVIQQNVAVSGTKGQSVHMDVHGEPLDQGPWHSDFECDLELILVRLAQIHKTEDTLGQVAQK